MFFRWRLYWVAFMLLGFCAPHVQSEPSVTEKNWVNDEILNQLQVIRQELKLLRNEIKNLTTNTVSAKAAFPVANRLGSENAQVGIIEFTDYQCAYCKRHAQSTFEKIKQTYIDAGAVQYALRDLPLSIHAQAIDAAVAARCAGEQGKYWEMHEQLFNAGRNMNAGFYQRSASQLGLNIKQFANCQNKGKEQEKVKKDMAIAKNEGVSGTPFFLLGRIKGNQLVDVRRLSGAQPFSAFENVIRSLLAEPAQDSAG
jgi:protein-disulfide isomerase